MGNAHGLRQFEKHKQLNVGAIHTGCKTIEAALFGQPLFLLGIFIRGN
jgi:hypothetical protein